MALTPLNLLHSDIVRVLGEGLEIARIRSKHHPARFCQGDDKRINRRTSPCLPPQQSSSPCQRFGNLLHEVTRLEKSVRENVAARMALQTFHEYHRGNQGRP